MTVQIEVFTKKVQNKDGQKFTAYYTKMKDGNNATVKFTKEVPNEIKPKFHSYLLVNENCANLANNGKYLTLWISKIDAVKEIKEDLQKYFECFDEDDVFDKMNKEIDKNE